MSIQKFYKQNLKINTNLKLSKLRICTGNGVQDMYTPLVEVI